MSAPGAGGAVVWFTGLPSSGKSTMARELEARLGTVGLRPIRLDGDEIRDILVPRPGYDEEGRADFYLTLAQLAALLAGQGHVVLVAATAHRRLYRERARSLAPAYLEVHVATAVETCRQRDIKGLYAAAQSSALELPGGRVAYEPPLDSEVVAEDGKDERAVQSVLTWCAARFGGSPRPC